MKKQVRFMSRFDQLTAYLFFLATDESYYLVQILFFFRLM